MHDLNMISCDGQRPWFAGDPQGLNMRNSMASQPASSASRAFVRGETERSGSAMYSHLYFLGMLVGAATLLLRREELRLVGPQLPLIPRRAAAAVSQEVQAGTVARVRCHAVVAAPVLLRHLHVVVGAVLPRQPASSCKGSWC